MNALVVITVPACLAIGVLVLAWYLGVRRRPRAIGSAIPTLFAVSFDEIHGFCSAQEQSRSRARHLRRNADRKQTEVILEYIAQMKGNTRSILQVAKFEALKIDPAKSSLQYNPSETLALRLTDEARSIRRLLTKAQCAMIITQITGVSVGQKSLETLMSLTREYKQLEGDVVQWVRMGSDDFYYAMLIERLGLSNWGLHEGGGFAE